MALWLDFALPAAVFGPVLVLVTGQFSLQARFGLPTAGSRECRAFRADRYRIQLR